jgi:hypothetical protein
MTFWVAGATVVGGLIGASGARSAASTQADAANRAAELQRQTYQEQTALNAPWREAGLTGQNRLMQLLGLGGDAGAAGYGKYSRDFGMQDFQQDPGYAFRLSEGQKALDRSAAARGGLISGGALKAATRYGQDMGSQEYGNAFNRYQTNRTNQLQPLGNLMASGQAATNQQAAQAGQYGQNAGNLIGQAGQATAAGQMGAANTWNNALGTMASTYQNQNNFNNWLAQNQMGIANQSGDPLGSLIAQRGW